MQQARKKPIQPVETLRRIVLVDDHPMIRQAVTEAIAQYLPEAGICGESSRAEEGLRMILDAKPDLVILDIGLEDGHGLDLIERILQAVPRTRILVFSMHDESLYAERAMRFGAMGYVNKRTPPETLVEAIRTVLAGKTFISPQMSNQLLAQYLNGQKESAPGGMEILSERELETFELMGQGKTMREIAELLHLSTKTVDAYRQRIKTKLKIQTNNELIRRAVSHTLKT